VGEGGEGALFLQVNRNKKCITSIDEAEGQEVMRRWSRPPTSSSPTCRRRPTARDEARLRLAEGDQAGHHPDRNCVRRAGTVSTVSL